MPLKFKTNAGSSDFKNVPSGSHIAICNLVADCGLQPGSASFPAPKQKIYIRFEIPNERIQYDRDGKHYDQPAVIGSFYTASMHEKATLRKHLEGWRGKVFTDDEAENFDVAAILGKPCMLSVVENSVGGKTYTNIVSIGALPKGVHVPKAENELLYFAEDNTGTFSKLPEWLQKKINEQLTAKPQQPEPQHYFAGDGTEITDDDIPF